MLPRGQITALETVGADLIACLRRVAGEEIPDECVGHAVYDLPAVGRSRGGGLEAGMLRHEADEVRYAPAKAEIDAAVWVELNVEVALVSGDGG